MDKRPIGVFDSGVGGLTITKEILLNLPNEELIYFGDSLRAPFGDLSKDVLLIYSQEICDFLMSKNVKALVIACNTMCANCLDIIVEKYDVPVIDVVMPSINEALDFAEKSVGLLATMATIKSGVHERALKIQNPSLEFHSVACPKLLPLIEGGNFHTQAAYDVSKEYLEILLENQIDTCILGCTHYPLILGHIKEILGKDIKIIDPSYGTAISLKNTLSKKNMLRESIDKPKHQFFVSGNKKTFDVISKEVFGVGYETEIVKL